MREIDLLPEWYKSGKRRQMGYRTQYLALGGVLLVIIVWNLIAASTLAGEKKALVNLQSRQDAAETTLRKCDELKAQIEMVRKKADILREIDSRIDIVKVLAEMSFLIDDDVVLRRVSFKAEPFDDTKDPARGAGAAIRSAKSGQTLQNLPLGNVRFKIMLSGLASRAQKVAELVCKLEDSPYFSQVVPLFSRNATVQAGEEPARQTYQASEFEITCELANYAESAKDI